MSKTWSITVRAFDRIRTTRVTGETFDEARDRALAEANVLVTGSEVVDPTARDYEPPVEQRWQP